MRTPAECLGALLRRGIGLALAGGRDAQHGGGDDRVDLTRSGRDPTVVLASAVIATGGWARLGQGPHVVVDALIGGAATDWGLLAPRLAVILDDPIDRGAWRRSTTPGKDAWNRSPRGA